MLRVQSPLPSDLEDIVHRTIGCCVLVTYRGQPVCHHRIDFVVDGRLLLELKAVDRLTDTHRAQVLSYLRVSRLPVGLLINFNEIVLKNGIKRIIL